MSNCLNEHDRLGRHRARLFSVVNPVFYIGGNVIQYVNKWLHLGNIIYANNIRYKVSKVQSYWPD